MIKEWFLVFKKNKSNKQFSEQQAVLQQMLDAGQDIHERDTNGRSALEYLFSKPSPSVDAVTWLINQPGFKSIKEASLYPYRIDLPEGYGQRTVANNMMDKLANLMPSDICNIEDIDMKIRLAQPFLLLLAKFEEAELTNKCQHSSEFYKNKLTDALKKQQKLIALEEQFDDLNIGFRMLPGSYSNELQSRYAGVPWLPTSDLPTLLANDKNLKMAFQINFEELKGLNPALPSKGLLQVFITDLDDDDGDEPIDGCEAFYWSDVDIKSPVWIKYSDRALETSQLTPSAFYQNPIYWKPYTQLPDSEDEIALALEKLDDQSRPNVDSNLQYQHGLMPRVDGLNRLCVTENHTCYEEPYLPKNHIAILNLTYTDHGGSLYSIPADALRGDDTDWRQLTHTSYHD